MKQYIKPALIGIVPALILGFGFNFLISILSGMEKVKETSFIWTWGGLAFFEFLFVFRNNGKSILGRALKFAAYECWLSPLCVIIYSITSVSQADKSVGSAGAFGAGLGGMVLVLVFAIGGGLLGVVLFLIGKATTVESKKIQPVQATAAEPPAYITEPPKDYSDWLRQNWGHAAAAAAVLLILLVVMISQINTQKTENSNLGTNSATSTATATSSSPPNAATTPVVNYGVTDLERNVIHMLIASEMHAFVAGHKNMFDPKDLGVDVITTPGALAKAYEQNEVSADNLFKGKVIVMAGAVDGIGKDFSDGAVIHFKGTNMFLDVNAYMDNEDINTVATMKKGEKISLVCLGNGSAMNSPTLTNCKTGLAELTKRGMVHFDEFMAGKEPENGKMLALASMAMVEASILPENSSCAQPDNDMKCIHELMKLIEKKPMTLKDASQVSINIRKFEKVGLVTHQTADKTIEALSHHQIP